MFLFRKMYWKICAKQKEIYQNIRVKQKNKFLFSISQKKTQHNGCY